MRKIRSIHIKAGFLFIVFAMHSLMSFACSLGWMMGNSSKHPESVEKKDALVHFQKDGKKHDHHQGKQSGTSNKDHTPPKEPKKKAHGSKKCHDTSKAANLGKCQNEKDNCCTDEVIKFQQVDKLLPHSSGDYHLVFPPALVITSYNFPLLHYTNVVKDVKPFVRNHHPPIADIRIAIQSFQI